MGRVIELEEENKRVKKRKRSLFKRSVVARELADDQML